MNAYGLDMNEIFISGEKSLCTGFAALAVALRCIARLEEFKFFETVCHCARTHIGSHSYGLVLVCLGVGSPMLLHAMHI